MSFPGRPPMGMPGMAPRMMPQGFAFAPMGMMPMQMGMMGPMMRPMMTAQVTTQQQQQQISQQKQNKKLVPQEIPKSDKKEEKPPVTTVFVGNISDRAPDMMIKQMLQRCGNVLSWKRVQGASGKLQAFGFCEYEDPEATLRCIRLLNEWNIADKKLVVKVDAKTKTLLDDYRKKKQQPDGEKSDSSEKKDDEDVVENGEKKGDGESSSKPEEVDELDEDSKREDRVAKAGLEAIMREYAFELAKEPVSKTDKGQDKDKMLPKKSDNMMAHSKDTGFDDLDMEDEKKDLISREINKFRDRHKDEDDDKDKDRDMAKERERRLEEKRRKERLERMQREREILNRERQAPARSRSKSRSESPPRRKREKSRSREKSSRDRSRERRKEREIEEEEEAYERRKLEKKLREKEAAYQERLKNWEARERKKSREYEKENEREDERKAEEVREARRLKEFLEDYDDLRDDPKFYKGSALMRRLKEREKEKEADNRDRQREKEEFEEIKRKLFDQGHPDAETEVARMEREREEHLRPRLQLLQEKKPSNDSDSDGEIHEEPSKAASRSPALVMAAAAAAAPPPAPQLQPIASVAAKPDREPPRMERESLSTSPVSEDSRISAPPLFLDETSQSSLTAPAPHTVKEELKPSALSRIGASISPADTMSQSAMTAMPSSSSPSGSGKRRKLTVGDVFNQDDDDNGEPKKRKLIPLDYGEDSNSSTSQLEKKPVTAEEKRQRIKQLIENIPTAKDELFAYVIDWDIVDQSLMDKRIKPWVTKKIIEYIGEEEATLTDFICQKVVARSTPQSIQNDVAMILDEEAEVFVVKMWRLLVYETEAKKLGLVK